MQAAIQASEQGASKLASQTDRQTSTQGGKQAAENSLSTDSVPCRHARKPEVKRITLNYSFTTIIRETLRAEIIVRAADARGYLFALTVANEIRDAVDSSFSESTRGNL